MITPKRLAISEAQDITLIAYATLAGVTAIITLMNFHNKTGSTESITIAIEPNGGSDLILIKQDILANATYFVNDRIVLNPLEQIKITASANSAIDYQISGVEIT